MAKQKYYSTSYVSLFSWVHYPLYWVLANLMKRSNRFLIKPEDVNLNHRYVFCLNHRGSPDFFVVFFGMPAWFHRKIAPYRFFIANRFFKNWFVRWQALSFGGFPAKEHPYLDYGLDAANRALDRGDPVVIFPEGRVGMVDREHKPKKGVAILAKRIDVRIVPVRVNWDRSKKLFRSYDVVVGKPFDGSKMNENQIMDVVYDLRFESKK